MSENNITEPRQLIEENNELYNTERVAIYHRGNQMNDTYSGRVLVVDGRVVFKEKRFSTFGEADMTKFAIRCGFADTRSFFEHYEKLTNGQPFYGIIRFKDGWRWAEYMIDKIDRLMRKDKADNPFLLSKIFGTRIIYWLAVLLFGYSVGITYCLFRFL